MDKQAENDAAGEEGVMTRWYDESGDRGGRDADGWEPSRRHRRLTVNISTKRSREIHFGAIVSTTASAVIEWVVLANQ